MRTLISVHDMYHKLQHLLQVCIYCICKVYHFKFVTVRGLQIDVAVCDDSLGRVLSDRRHLFSVPSNFSQVKIKRIAVCISRSWNQLLLVFSTCYQMDKAKCHFSINYVYYVSVCVSQWICVLEPAFMYALPSMYVRERMCVSVSKEREKKRGFDALRFQK